MLYLLFSSILSMFSIPPLRYSDSSHATTYSIQVANSIPITARSYETPNKSEIRCNEGTFRISARKTDPENRVKKRRSTLQHSTYLSEYHSELMYKLENQKGQMGEPINLERIERFKSRPLHKPIPTAP